MVKTSVRGAVSASESSSRTGESLQARLARVGSPVRMLRHASSGRFKSPYPDQYTSWQDEQRAWADSAVLFDQSHHMTDVYFRGTGVLDLLRDTGTNSWAGFGRDKAKHFIACNRQGHMIGSAVLFGLSDHEVCLVGPAAAANWVQYQAEIGRYDVEVARDERTRDAGGAGRRLYRFEIEGPAVPDILERATGARIDPVPFFHMTRFQIGGRTVRALSHTMAGVPGAESMGYEIFGPAEDGPRVHDALLEAGADLGLLRGGMLAYYTGGVESGYAAQPTPAVYTGDDMEHYREWLRGDGYEGTISIGGSFVSDRIEDYYVTPFDFGYSHLVRFDHDFIGADALRSAVDTPRRRKVWLRWADDDVSRVYASSLFGGPRRAKYLDTPLGRYARVMVDTVRVGDRLVGVSTICGYTVNIGGWCSIGFVDEEHAIDGAEVIITWGEPDGGTRKPHVERHVQTDIRAYVSTRPPTA